MELQEGLGTVILRTASGWKPQVSGVSSAALELSEELSVLSRDQRVAGEKTWIWFNVSPTFQMLRLAHTSGQRAFASLPVVSDTVTWMDAVEIKSEALRGRIFAASSARAQGVARAELRIPGEAVAVATTDAHGRFQLKEWFRVGNHPVDLEVWSRDDYPNRYRTFPSADQPLTVFFFDSKAVRAWTDQLQGGLSSAGGLLIGAAGDFVSRQSLQGDAVYPDVRSLSSAAMLKPETYTVSSQDQLLVHRPLDVYAPRYLGVQLPEGPVDVALLTQEGKELRRELIISSPGVVNVLSPR
jgi:hypothetical protein